MELMWGLCLGSEDGANYIQTQDIEEDIPSSPASIVARVVASLDIVPSAEPLQVSKPEPN